MDFVVSARYWYMDLKWYRDVSRMCTRQAASPASEPLTRCFSTAENGLPVAGETLRTGRLTWCESERVRWGFCKLS